MSYATKVLHVVESVDRGAVENWLLRMLQHAHGRGESLDWTFYCTLNSPGVLEGKAEALGARIIRSQSTLDSQFAFIRCLRAELKRGCYDVLHCHHDLVSGLYLSAATNLSIRRQIVHVHNADENVLTPNRWKQRAYRPILRGLCLSKADGIVGISHHTLDTFLAGRPRRPERDMVHYYGVDSAPFGSRPPDRAAFRRSLGLPQDALLLLFGGRIVPEKNPVFTVNVLSALRRLDKRTIAIFAGAGSQEAAVLARAGELGLQDAVKMLGWRNDLPEVMRCADWFILPRPEYPLEGFGLAVVEAQLAGLRLLVSRGVPDDPFLPSARFCRLPLAASADEWAAAAVELLNGPTPSPEVARIELAASAMDMDRALSGLKALHQ